MSKYTFYEDPGHGWLRVRIAHLVALGIDDKISTCSYCDNIHYAYLEEDSDLTTFLDAELPGLDWPERRKWYAENVEHNDRAALTGAPEIFIRKLPSYSPYWRKTA